MQILHPAEHLELHGKLKESQDRGTIESALDRLSGILEENGVEGVDLSGRPKNLYGIMRKMKDKQKGLNQVYDVRALRVIVKSKADCYRVLQQVATCQNPILFDFCTNKSLPVCLVCSITIIWVTLLLLAPTAYSRGHCHAKGYFQGFTRAI